jgi:hypothetical protein
MPTDCYEIELGATMESEFQDWCLKPLGHPSKIGLFEYTEFVGKSSMKPCSAIRECVAGRVKTQCFRAAD